MRIRILEMGEASGIITDVFDALGRELLKRGFAVHVGETGIETAVAGPPEAAVLDHPGQEKRG